MVDPWLVTGLHGQTIGTGILSRLRDYRYLCRYLPVLGHRVYEQSRPTDIPHLRYVQARGMPIKFQPDTSLTP